MDTRLLKYMQSVQEYKKELDSISEKWDFLTMMGKMSNTGMDMNNTRNAFERLTSDLLEKLGTEILKKVTSEIQAKAQVAVDIVIRNLFERTADIGFLATDEDIRIFIKEVNSATTDDEGRQKIREGRQKIRNRFKEYVAKYSVYSNIVLMDTNGNIILQLDETSNIKKSSDPLIQEALRTSSEYVEIYRETDLAPNAEKALVYSFRVTSSNSDDSLGLGVLSLVFKFEDEMMGIFKNLITESDWMEIMLLDSDGYTISSSDEYHIPLGVKMQKVTGSDYQIVRFGGREYLAKTCATKGYQEFFGLGWYGHVMLPLEHAFDKPPKSYASITVNMLDTLLRESKLFSEELKHIPQEADKIQKELDVTVWNGNVQIANTKNSEVSFSKSLLNEISKTGLQTKKVFENSISNLNQTVLSAYLEDAQFNASLAIDIMDRNLYERANDCRWWALTSVFKQKLEKSQLESDDIKELEDILLYINNLYTVYTNLFLYDSKHTIVAVSNPEQRAILGAKVNDISIDALDSCGDTQRYSVSEFSKSAFYNNRYTYIYYANITDYSNENSVGGIGIVFDSEPQFKDMLCDALPLSKEGSVIEGSFGLFTDREKNIISSTSSSYKVGSKLNIDDSYFKYENGKGNSGIVELDNEIYVVGVHTSNGYREYKRHDYYSNDVISFIFVKVSSHSDKENKHELTETPKLYAYPEIHGSEERIDISTFYIGEKFFGIESSSIVCLLSNQNITKILGSDEYFIGVVNIPDQETVGVVSINKLLDIDKCYDPLNDELIVVKFKNEKEIKFAIAISDIGESPEIPVRSIKAYSGSLAGEGLLTKAVVVPDNVVDRKEMLSILDIGEIYNTLIKKKQKNYID